MDLHFREHAIARALAESKAQPVSRAYAYASSVHSYASPSSPASTLLGSGSHAATRRCGAVPACALHRARCGRITPGWDTDVESSADEEECRPSPASPSLAPESEEEEAEALLENAPHVLTEEAVSAPVPVESDVPLAPSEQAASPAPTPAALVREPSPAPAVVPAPPPVFKVSFKE
ncbi:hypothetical protein B0H17DRAFT_1205259 [Mycena rosella]|uniref:Uncharacterized protein n=1 Tax=Mycena rosella TaxID=1033263 RepID=A0AAD7D7T5_MYCRO|nr:hypothetical protein B0H17DRAFT_1205259 [Mycena rosella]